MKSKKVLTIGGATQDIFLHYENPELLTLEEDYKKRTCLLLEEGSKIDVKKINYHTGGGATNSGVSFTRLGLDTYAIFKIGNDFQGEFILNELKKEKLKSIISYSKNYPTAISFILPTPSDRIILAFRGTNIDLQENDIPENLIKDINLIYITSLSGKASKLLFPITKLAKKNNKKVAVNPGIGQLKKEKIKDFIQSLKNIDILILNSKEAEELINNLLKEKEYSDYKFNSKKISKKQDVPGLIKSFMKYKNNLLTIHAYFELIFKTGPKIAVVTNGAEGVYVAHNDVIYFHKSIKPEKIVNTLGAGDAFGSCFVASLLHKKSIEDSLFCGIINASSVISYEGAKTGLLNFDQLEEKQKELNHLKNPVKFDL